MRIPADSSWQVLIGAICRFAERLAADQQTTLKPDVDTPFVDAEDVVRRLLPYHIYQQPKEDLEKLISPKGKGKAEQQQAATNTGFMTLPAPQASPGPRAGFSRIGTVAEADRSGTGTPVGERSKVQFGLKRKAEGEHESTPPPAKRQ